MRLALFRWPKISSEANSHSSIPVDCLDSPILEDYTSVLRHNAEVKIRFGSSDKIST